MALAEFKRSAVPLPAAYAGQRIVIIETNGVRAECLSDGAAWTVQGVVFGAGIPGNALFELKKTFRLNPKAMAVMAAPPTPAISTNNPLSAGQAWPATNSDATRALAGSAFNLFRTNYLRTASAGFPGYSYLVGDTLTQGTPQAYATFIGQVSVEHTGSRAVFAFGGNGCNLMTKVNGEFVTLTPLVVPNDGGLYYYDLPFASPDKRRIDIIGGGSMLFAGIFTGLTDTLLPGLQRGPSVTVFNDSFGEGTGAAGAGLLSWIFYFAEWLGWDNVVSSCVGSTGLVATVAQKVNFVQRAARDAATSQVILCKMSTNDAPYTAAEVLQAAKDFVAAIVATGIPREFIFASPTINKGAGAVATSLRQQKEAVKAWCATQGYVFIDDMEMPSETAFSSRHTTTITAPVAANATSIQTAVKLAGGSTYKFDDGTVFFVRSASGTTATVDMVRVAQSAGATVTQCGPCYLTGTGNRQSLAGWGNCDLNVGDGVSDPTHPSPAGHRELGTVDAALLVRALTL